MVDWDDLRYLLALERHGSMKLAAKSIGTDPTTVSRRIKRLSKEAKSTLASPERDGKWKLTESGRKLVSAAASFEGNISSLLKPESEVSNNYIISTLEFVALTFLVPKLDKITNVLSNQTLSVNCEDKCVSLAYGDADLVLRMSRPSDGKLIVSHLGNAMMSTFSPDGLPRREWIGLPMKYSWTPEMKLGLEYFGCPPSLSLGSFSAIRQASLSMDMGCIGPVLSMSPLIQIESCTSVPREIWSAFHESRKYDSTLEKIRLWAKQCITDENARHETRLLYSHPRLQLTTKKIRAL